MLPRIRSPAVLFIIVLLFVPFTWLTLFAGSDVSEEQLLQNKIIELRERLRYAEKLHQERRRDAVNLRNQFNVIIRYGRQNLINSTGFDGLIDQRARQVLFNMSNGIDLQLPSIYDHMPHLMGQPKSLIPRIKLSQGRSGVSMVLGIPTIKRDKKNYLYDTLRSILENVSSDEADDILIVVMIAELDRQFVDTVIDSVKETFPSQLSSGLLEVIVPPASYYPNFTSHTLTFGDSPERSKWRTKQNLDFAFLMMYAQSKGMYYVQLEDDIITKPGFTTAMKDFALKQKSDDWMLLEFSQLGFIGKLFKSSDLPIFIQFFIMFHQEKPVDWLLDHVFYVKVCNPERDAKSCARSKADIRKRFKPSLFQHIGTHSSLKGKAQKLKDKDFGKGMKLHRAHPNPVAEVSTTLKTYQSYSLKRVYLGETYFWGLLPQAGDSVTFTFTPPVALKMVYIRSGNIAHPDDRFYNTTVEISFPPGKTVEREHVANYTRMDDGFYVVTYFKEAGVAQVSLAHISIPIATLRLTVLSESENWVIISEIQFKSAAAKNFSSTVNRLL